MIIFNVIECVNTKTHENTIPKNVNKIIKWELYKYNLFLDSKNSTII